jgi:hypothetical protein
VEPFDGRAVALSREGPTRRGRDSLGERRDKFPEFRLLDQRDRLAWFDPLNRPLFELGPDLALSRDQQGKDSHFANRPDSRLVEKLVVGEESQGLPANLPPDAGLFERLARGRLRRLQPFDGPALRNDPSFRLAGRDEKEFERRVLGETVGKRAVLDADGLSGLSLGLSSFDPRLELGPSRFLLCFARNLRSPDSTR